MLAGPRPFVALLIATLTLPVLAGCLGDAPAGGGGTLVVPPDVAAYALPRLVQAHDHENDHAEHVGRMGFDALGFAQGPQGAGLGELVVKGGHAYLAFSRASGFVDPAGVAGFTIYDLAEPTKPEPVGTWYGQPLGDLEVTDDGAYAFTATQRNGYPYTWALNVPADGLAPRGITVVDVSTKSAPETASFTPLPTNGPHTVNYVRHPDGRELLFAMTYDILFTAYPDNVGHNQLSQRVIIYEFERGPTPHLVPLSTFQIIEPEAEGQQFMPHDATAHVDPATDRLIMDIAHWDLGLVTVDITDPSAPQELARFDDTSPSAYVHTHLVRVFPGLIDGRVVGVLEPEIPNGDDTGTFTFVDLTDPAKPQRLGAWMMPGELVIDQPFLFSPHNFDLVCGGNGQVTGRVVDYGAPCVEPTVVLSHNHGGLWALDASDPTAPRATGFFFPAKAEGGPVPQGFGTVFVQDGFVYAPEYRSGLHVLRLSAPGSA